MLDYNSTEDALCQEISVLLYKFFILAISLCYLLEINVIIFTIYFTEVCYEQKTAQKAG